MNHFIRISDALISLPPFRASNSRSKINNALPSFPITSNCSTMFFAVCSASPIPFLKWVVILPRHFSVGFVCWIPGRCETAQKKESQVRGSLFRLTSESIILDFVVGIALPLPISGGLFSFHYW